MSPKFVNMVAIIHKNYDFLIFLNEIRENSFVSFFEYVCIFSTNADISVV